MSEISKKPLLGFWISLEENRNFINTGNFTKDDFLQRVRILPKTEVFGSAKGLMRYRLNRFV